MFCICLVCFFIAGAVAACRRESVQWNWWYFVSVLFQFRASQGEEHAFFFDVVDAAKVEVRVGRSGERQEQRDVLHRIHTMVS